MFLNSLAANGINFYTGVGCSILADLFRLLEEQAQVTVTTGDSHLFEFIPSTREDLAIGLAAGAYLAGRKPSVLMQNSGLGYSLNALTSLNLIFQIPTLLIIGYRGAEPGDAPEHWVMGRSCAKILETIGIPHWVPDGETLIPNAKEAIQTMEKEKIPVALLIKAGILC